MRINTIKRKQALVFALAFLVSAPAIAVLTDNWQKSPNLEGISSLGEGGVGYFGQTFIAASEQLDQVEIAVKPHGPYDTKLRVLIVEVTPITQPDPTLKPRLNPTSVLFESAEILLPAESPGTSTNPVDFTTITIDIDGVTLIAGSTYGFLLDVFESLDGSDDSATVGANEHIYDDGVHFYYGRGTNSAPGTRAARFSDSAFWVAEDTGVDIRFRLSFAETPQPNAVELDITPGGDPNSISPKSKAVISVAVLTTDTFDATTIDPLSVQFGPNGATETHNRGHIEDVDGDGDDDMVLHFRTQETGIQCGDTQVGLTGMTVDGQEIEGDDSIQTVGCQ